MTLGAVVALYTQTPDSLAAVDAGAMIFGGFVAVAMGAAAGAAYCLGTLFWAALTMPPTLWLIRMLDLPRPAMDVIGGGVMGLICAMLGVSRGVPASMFTPEAGQVFATIGLVTGCILGFVRHALLVRSRKSPEQGLARVV
ncbi:MAG: hypothetical protein J0L81_09995 [Caulobacterales bacterium]|nr:hypothetical protein [Caulobacterales bacterium]